MSCPSRLSTTPHFMSAPFRPDPLHINSHIFYELYLPYLLMLLCKLAFGSNMHPHSLARYKFITKILLYVYMQRIRPEGSRHEVGGVDSREGGRREVEQNTSREGAMRNIGEFTRCCLDGILIKIG